ncbi:MAG: catalase [Bdellovibrionales bacterium]|nr:catalase [Bdellovibrionales bacterium]
MLNKLFWLVALISVVGIALAEDPDPVSISIGNLFEKVMRASGPPRSEIMRRPVFAKAHGCLKAKFEVNPDLPEQYRVGVFSKPSYWAWVRFANDGGFGTDKRPAARGMAIKVVGVEGRKILDGEEDAVTQDFVMQNHPIFFNKNAKDFLDFVEASVSGDPEKIKAYDEAHPETQKILDEMDLNFLADPLAGRYWTPTPYKLGDKAMKYMVKPCMEGDNFLRENLVRRMQNQDVCFGFWVQFQTDEKSAPVDDATVKWPEEGEGKFRRFATLRIPTGQDVNEKEREALCEDLSFTGWHATKELEPLGSINLARKHVYKRMADIRRRKNGALLKEPVEITPVASEKKK